ncbi:metalloregulator ArsR/SmtB family transcription factor [Hahella sp. KA22]|nr:methyltransferase domain-containing protein [Hahella sp. KA22]QAY57260.1 metalloregulator ArsR/SmtB family transcription factor [Hahella sp. KA22]
MLLNFRPMNDSMLPHSDGADTEAVADYAELAGVYKACGDALRLEILRVLERNAYGVLELCSIFDVKQSAMSHHLKVLAKARMVEAQREGNSIFYRRPILAGDDSAELARLQLFSNLDLMPLTTDTRDRIGNVGEQRAQQSQAFFSRYAEHFQAHQELIAEYPLYATPVRDMLQQQLAGEKVNRLLEIGPGEGAFLEDLSTMADSVIALDNSEEMLQKARDFADARHLSNVRFIVGDTRSALEQGVSVDVIVMNMVLHHVASPADMIRDCAALLRPGGMLVLSDLSRHDQSWARESCGDLWLGFDSTEISRWGAQSGLTEGESIYIGVRNGFQIQVRQFLLPKNGSRTLTGEAACQSEGSATSTHPSHCNL